MKKMYRTMLLFTATVIFLAVAPLVVLYAIGYRTGFSTVDPVPVGVLFMETIPKRAELALNTVDYGDTPRTVSGLLSGEVHASVSKEGYQPWAKTIHIEPGLVSEFRDVRLFPAKIKKTVLSTDISSFSLSPNRRLLAVIKTDKKLSVLDEEGLVVHAPVQLAVMPSQLLWSPDNARLLLLYNKGPGQIMVLGSTLSQPPFLKVLTSITQSAWDPRIPGRILLLTNTGELKAYNYINGSVHILAENIATFATSSRYIYAINHDNSLTTYALSGEVISTVDIDAPSPIKQILITPAGKKVILTQDKTLYELFDTHELKEIAEQVQSVGWSPDGQLLYVQPEENALYVYNASQDALPWLPAGQMELVLRLSRPITEPQWFAGSKHLIFQIGDEIIISEIDTRDKALQFPIDTTNMGNASVTVGQDGKSLFYMIKQGQSPAVVSGQLQ